jgi:AraC-like DNA-binding protein
MPVSYGEFEPAPDLRPLIASYWVFRVEGALPDGFAHSVPLDGAVSLFFSRRIGVPLVLGPRTEPLRPPVVEGDVVHGVRLWPGAAAAALRADVPALRDQVLPLERVLPGDWAERFREAVALDAGDDEQTVRRLDEAWAPLVARRADLDAAVMRAVFAIVHSQGQVPVGRLAAECGLSERHLRRRFVAAVGLSPKELARIRRLRASLVEALGDPQRRWVELAAACGYADQAHLVREYRRLSGLAPEAFLAHLERIHHGRVTP